MADVLQAMSISGGILLLVVGLILVLSIAAVKRGETAMHGVYDTKAWWNTGVSVSAAGAAASKPMTSADISVLQILGVGTALFVVAVLLLFAVSVVGHL
jgi:hypothetical protein